MTAQMAMSCKEMQNAGAGGSINGLLSHVI